MVWAGKKGKGTRVDRGAGEELAMSPQPCLAGRGRWVEGTMEDGDSLLHPISAASWDSREPSGILGSGCYSLLCPPRTGLLATGLATQL